MPASGNEPGGLQDIVSAQAEIRSLEAGFVQTKTLALFDETIVASGTVVIEKPDFYCWTYNAPERRVFYVDGLRSGSFEAGSGSREEVDLGDRKGFASTIQSVISIMTGNLEESTQSDYEILQNPSTEEFLSYTFRPRLAEIQSLFEQVSIRFDSKTRLALDLEMVEANGDSSYMEFNDWRINIPVNRFELLE